MGTWWRGQHLDEAREDASGRRWHFRVWHGVVNDRYLQRVFFWNEDRSETGAIEMAADKTLHVSRIRQVMTKVVQQPAYRARFVRELRFPVERHYSRYAPFD